jgi:hypothetical protein
MGEHVDRLHGRGVVCSTYTSVSLSKNFSSPQCIFEIDLAIPNSPLSIFNMLFKLSLVALAGQALAQSTPTLQQALNSTSSLSTLASVLGLTQLTEALGNAKNVTILAPSNQAFARIDNATLGALTANPGLLTALLQ